MFFLSKSRSFVRTMQPSWYIRASSRFLLYVQKHSTCIFHERTPPPLSGLANTNNFKRFDLCSLGVSESLVSLPKTDNINPESTLVTVSAVLDETLPMDQVIWKLLLQDQKSVFSWYLLFHLSYTKRRSVQVHLSCFTDLVLMDTCHQWDEN